MPEKESNVVLNFKMDGQVQYAKTIKDINAVMNAASKEYRTHVAAMGKDASATDKLAAEKKKLQIQMEAAKERTAMLRAEYERMSQDSSTTTAQLANMHGKLQDSERAEISLQNSMDKVNQGLSDQSEETRKSQEAMEQLETESEQLESQTEKLNAEYELQKAQLGENASESDKLRLELDHLSDQHELAGEKVDNYEQQLEEAKKQYGENSTEADGYETKLLEARTAEQKLANEIVETNDKLKEQTDKFKKASDGLKKAGQGMRTAGKGFTKYVTAPIVGAGTAAIAAAKKTGDYANEVLNLSKSTGTGAEAFQELNIAFGDYNLEQADTEKTLGRLNQRMGLAQNGSKKYQKALKAVGISQKDLKDGTYTTDEAFMKIVGTLHDVKNGQKRTALATDLFGTKLSRKLLPVIDGGTDKLKGLRNEAKDTGQVLSEDALDDAEDFSLAMDGLKDAMTGVVHKVGADLAPVMTEKLIPAIQDNLVPALEKLGGFLSDAIEWFANLSPGMQKTIGIIVGLVAAFGPLLVAFSFMATGLAGVIDFIPKLITGLKGLGIALKFLSTNPIVLIIAAVAALIAIGILVWKNWDTIRAKAIQIWGAISGWFSKIWGQIKSTFAAALAWLDSKTGGKFSDIINVIKRYMQMGKEIISAIITFWKNTFKNAMDFLRALVNGDFKGMYNAIKSQMQNAKQLIQSIWNSVKSFFGDILGDMLSKAKSKFNSIKHAIMNPIHKARDAFKAAIDTIKGLFDFKFSWPHIPMPHFHVSGSANPLRWLEEGVPTIDVEWRKKGGIFTQPTIFGASGGSLQGAGEAGPEAVLPLNEETLSNIGKGIAANMEGINGPAEIIVPLMVDGKEFARVTAPYMSKEINNNNSVKFRSKGV